MKLSQDLPSPFSRASRYVTGPKIGVSFIASKDSFSRAVLLYIFVNYVLGKVPVCSDSLRNLGKLGISVDQTNKTADGINLI